MIKNTEQNGTCLNAGVSGVEPYLKQLKEEKTMKNLRYSKKTYIRAIQQFFGTTKVDAKKYYNNCIARKAYNQLDGIVDFHKGQARLSFYND